MRSRRRLVAALSVTAAMLLVAACGGDDDSSDDTAPPETTAAPVETTSAPETTMASGEREIDPDGEVTLSASVGAPQFDPPLGVSTGVDQIYFNAIFDRLTILESDLSVGPALATEWSTPDDGLTWTFTLREGVEFHDGEPFNADAVVANYKRTQGTTSGTGAAQVANVADIVADSEYQVTFTLNTADPVFPKLIALFPESGSMISPASFDSPDVATNPVGTGLYTISEVTDTSITYEKQPGYWNQELAATAPAKATILFIADATAATNALVSGQVDTINPNLITPDLDALIDGENFFLHTFTSSNRAVIFAPNPNIPPFDDVRVRLALSKSINREAISEAAFNGHCAPTIQPFAPGIDGHVDSIDGSNYQDIEGAKALLADAGLTEVDATGVAGIGFESIGDVIQAQVKDAGFNITWDPVPLAQMLSTWRQNEHEVFAMIPGPMPEASLALGQYYTALNYLGTPDDDLQVLLDAAAVLPLDSAERAAAYEEVSKYLAENPTNIPVCFASPSVIYNNRVGGFENMAYPNVQLTNDIAKLVVYKN